MKFLYEKVYSNQYFALVLFATIAVLLILFGIVLFAAIKDTKKRKLAELDKLEKENINALHEKVNTLTSDEEVFGTTEAFTEEAPKEPLEFFRNEDEQSKTRDIVLTAPTTENSMNNLLNEFDDEKEQVAVSPFEVPVVNNGSNLLNAEVEQKDIVIPSFEIPTPEVQPVSEEVSLPPTPENVVVESPMPKVEETALASEIKEEPQTIIEDNEDEFELPAIKEVQVNNNLPLEKSVTPSESKSGIDFSKTGILNFTNIENETYEIK